MVVRVAMKNLHHPIFTLCIATGFAEASLGHVTMRVPEKNGTGSTSNGNADGYDLVQPHADRHDGAHVPAKRRNNDSPRNSSDSAMNASKLDSMQTITGTKNTISTAPDAAKLLLSPSASSSHSSRTKLETCTNCQSLDIWKCRTCASITCSACAGKEISMANLRMSICAQCNLGPSSLTYKNDHAANPKKNTPRGRSGQNKSSLNEDDSELSGAMFSPGPPSSMPLSPPDTPSQGDKSHANKPALASQLVAKNPPTEKQKHAPSSPGKNQKSYSETVEYIQQQYAAVVAAQENRIVAIKPHPNKPPRSRNRGDLTPAKSRRDSDSGQKDEDTAPQGESSRRSKGSDHHSSGTNHHNTGASKDGRTSANDSFTRKYGKGGVEIYADPPYTDDSDTDDKYRAKKEIEEKYYANEISNKPQDEAVVSMCPFCRSLHQGMLDMCGTCGRALHVDDGAFLAMAVRQAVACDGIPTVCMFVCVCARVCGMCICVCVCVWLCTCVCI
jgi:hypothetical protein